MSCGRAGSSTAHPTVRTFLSLFEEGVEQLEVRVCREDNRAGGLWGATGTASVEFLTAIVPSRRSLTAQRLEVVNLTGGDPSHGPGICLALLAAMLSFHRPALLRSARSVMLVSGLAVTAGTACEKVDSTDVRTSGIYVSVSISDNGDAQSRLTASLQVGGHLSNTYLVLKGEDRLLVWMGGQSYQMKDAGDLLGQEYGVTLPHPDVDTEVRIDFERGPDDTSAPNSTVVLPGRFHVASFGSDLYSRAGDTLSARWSPFDPSKVVDWYASGECLETVSTYGTADSGSATIPAGTFRSPPPRCDGDCDHKAPKIPPTTCNATFVVTKKREGIADSAFDSGRLSAQTDASASFFSVP
jgi:hypothetical protein